MSQKKGVYGLVYNKRNYYYHWCWVTGFDGNPFKNKKTTYNSVEQINAMEFAKSLEIGENAIMPADLNEEMAVAMFGNGKAGMIITGPWEINEFLKKGVYGLVYNNRNYYYHWCWVTGFDGNPFKNIHTRQNRLSKKYIKV